MSRILLPRSIRGRLTVWYAFALAGGLCVFVFASLAVLSVELEQRNDQFLVDARRAFLVELEVELKEMPTIAEAIDRALSEVRFEGTRFLVLAQPADRVQATPADLRLEPSGAAHADDARLVFDSVVHTELRKRRATPPSEGTPPDVRVPRMFTIAAEESAARGATWSAPARALVAREDARVALDIVRLRGDYYAVAALRERQGIHETLREVRRAYLFVIPFILLLAIGVGYWLARNALAPVATMSAQARRIGMTSLHERLPVQTPHDELGALASVMNELLARLDRGVAQQRGFVADASHELRTPVAILRAEAEVTLSHASRSEAEYRQTLAVMGNATERLSRIVEDLFLLARADGGQRIVEVRALYLDELLANAVRAITPLAAQCDVVITFGPAAAMDEGPTCHGDATLLDRVFLNLLDNAVKHSPPCGRVHVTLRTDGDWHVVDVRDEGAGIPPDAQPLVFDRFFRVDTARTRASSAGCKSPAELRTAAMASPQYSSGAGLGLAIARSIVEAHGGVVTLQESGPGGSCFRVLLPVPHGADRVRGARADTTSISA